MSIIMAYDTDLEGIGAVLGTRLRTGVIWSKVTAEMPDGMAYSDAFLCVVLCCAMRHILLCRIP